MPARRTTLRRPSVRAALLAAALLAPLGLAACGSESTDDAPAASGGDGTFPVSVDTAFGEVTVSEEPQRVVALGWGDAETALALGVQPVGASDWLAFGDDGLGPWAEGSYDEPPTIIDTLEPDYEAVAALEPDLILDTKSSGDPERYERLASIATTVGVPEGSENYLIEAADQVELVAQALGREEEGAEVLAEVDAAFEAAAEEHPEFDGRSVVAAAYTSEGWGAYVDGTERVSFLERLGFELKPEIAEAETEEFSIDVSTEDLDTLDADTLVTFPIYVDPAEITDQAAYEALPVVQDGRAVVLGDETISSAYSLASPQAQLFAIENVVPLLADSVAAGS